MAENAIFTSEMLEVLKEQGQIPEIILKKLELLVAKPFSALSEFETTLKILLSSDDFQKYYEIIADFIVQEEDDLELPFLKRGVEFIAAPQTIYELIVRKWKNHQLKLNIDIHRNLIWQSRQKSQFIESILLNYPLPPFCFNVIVEDKKYKYVVVDGKQRFITLHDFMHDQFKLENLKVLKHLNGKLFSDLGELCSNIEDKQLMVYLIPATVPIRIVFDIFNRMNPQNTQLGLQEIRNSIHYGVATQFLASLAASKTFKRAIHNVLSGRKNKDQEVVLRYLAFQLLDYKTQYKGMDDFLETTMKLMNTKNLFPTEKQQEIAANFERVMYYTYLFFGNQNFRITTPNRSRSVMNGAVLESVGSFFAGKSTVLQTMLLMQQSIQDNIIFKNIVLNVMLT
jgi:Protein of unknown function DUF262